MYDIVGADEFEMGDDDFVLGDDSDFVLGQDYMSALAGDDEFSLGGPRAKRRARARRIQPTNQTQVLNFPRGAAGGLTVAPGATVTLVARPQRPFQTERFVVSSAISPFFLIFDLVSGRESMFVNAEPASAEIFSQTGVHVAMKGFIARPGIDITLTVNNIDVAARPFLGSIIGPALV